MAFISTCFFENRWTCFSKDLVTFLLQAKFYAPFPLKLNALFVMYSRNGKYKNILFELISYFWGAYLIFIRINCIFVYAIFMYTHILFNFPEKFIFAKCSLLLSHSKTFETKIGKIMYVRQSLTFHRPSLNLMKFDSIFWRLAEPFI